MERTRITQMTKGIMLIGGVLAVIFGLILIFAPKLAVASFVLIFASYLMLLGVLRLVDASMISGNVWSKILWAVFGILSILGGIYLLIYPQTSIVLLAYGIAFYAGFLGAAEIAIALATKQRAGQTFWAIVRGVLSIIFSLFLLIYPSVAFKYLVLFMGWYSLIYGVILLAYGLFVRTDGLDD